MKNSIKRSAQLSGDGVLEIAIYDVIGAGWYGGVSAAWVRSVLEQAAGARKVNVLINSPGGDYFEGTAIYNELCSVDARVHVKVMGLAASAASMIAMAGDKITVMRGGMMMIHEAQAIIWADAAGLEKEAAVLRKMNGEIAGMYAMRGGGAGGAGKAKFLELMAAVTWLTGEEAKALGLADVAEGDPSSASGQADSTDGIDATLMRCHGIPECARHLFDAGSLERREKQGAQSRATVPHADVEARSRETRERCAFAGVELRADIEKRTITGMIPYNAETEIRHGEFEVIRPGAFAEVVKQSTDFTDSTDDVFAFWNHDSGIVLGSLGNGTLKIFDSAEGLRFEVSPPDSPEGNSKLESVARGDVKGVSFAFNPKAGGAPRKTRAAGGTLRELTSVKLWEVSPGVPFPAYAGASAEARGNDERGTMNDEQGEDAAFADRGLPGESFVGGMDAHGARLRLVGALI